jgi:cell division protein FtsI/penicillin-binding protein 2
MIKYFCDRCGKEIVANRSTQTIEYTYELSEPTDEEIQKEIDAAGLTGVVKPEGIRKYIRERIYELYCKTVSEKENNNGCH